MFINANPVCGKVRQKSDDAAPFPNRVDVQNIEPTQKLDQLLFLISEFLTHKRKIIRSSLYNIKTKFGMCVLCGQEKNTIVNGNSRSK